MAASTVDQDRVVVVAVVQWEIQGSTGRNDADDIINTSTTSKLRVRQRDIQDSGTACMCTGKHLLDLVKATLRTEFHRDPEAEGIDLQVDVYDNTQSCYVDALQAVEENICQRFGSRLKLCVRLTDNNKHGSSMIDDDENQDNIKAIMGRFYPYDESEGLVINGEKIRVHEESNQHNAGTGINLWDGALLLAQYLEKQPHLVRQKRVLELGAGVGLVGLAAGVLGAKEILMTDLQYALRNMRINVDRNFDLLKKSGCEKAVCGTCDWYDPPSLEELGAMMEKSVGNNNDGIDNQATILTEEEEAKPWTPDVILIADCVWMQELVAPLLATIQHFTTKTEQLTTRRPEVLISYQRRGKSTDEEFWTGLSGFNAKVNEIDVSVVGLTKPNSIYLLSLK